MMSSFLASMLSSQILIESPVHTNSSNDLVSFKPQSMKAVERLPASHVLIPDKSTNQAHPLIELHSLEALQWRCVLTENR